MRSISTIISTLKTSFRDTDFTEAESELKSMERKLRSDFDAAELQRSDLTVQNLRLEDENRRLKRDFEISDRRVSQLSRELSVVKEREEKGIKRYDCLIKSIRVLECEREKILEELREKNEEISELRVVGRGVDEANEKIRVLERVKSEFEVELDGLRRENEGLVAAKAKTDEEMEKMRRDLEDVIKGLREDLCEKYEENCELKGVERKNEGQIKELFERNEVLESELERVKWKFDDLCGEKERLVADVKGKNKQVEGLKRKLEDLEKKCEIMKGKDDVGMYLEVEERLSKVEEDVANWLLENVPTAKKVMGNQVEKVLSGVLNALDSEQNGWTDRVEDIVGRDSVASHLNEAEVNTTSSLETEVLPDTKVLPDSEVLSDTEVERLNKTIGVKRDPSLEVIVLSDSDCDNEDHIPINELKRQRVSSQCWNQSIKLENYSQNSSCKINQPINLPNEDSELSPSIAASHRSSDKFATSKKQKAAPLRQCNETSVDRVKGPMSRGMVDDDSCRLNGLSPLARELIATCHRGRL